MQFEVFTLLPEVFPAYLDTSILKRARERGLIQVNIHNIRDYTHDKHHTTDDTPYGGGGGMVMKPEPVFEAVESVLGREALQISPEAGSNIPVILLTPQGRVFDQTIAQELSQHKRIVLLCGRYEGVDERLLQAEVDDELSIGDYVLSGGELAAMVIIDAVTRQLPGALGHELSAQEDSFSDGLLDCPHYTRPEVYQGRQVPEVLLSGNHLQIRRWRLKQALGRTLERRPDLLDGRAMTPEEEQLLAEYLRERDESTDG